MLELKRKIELANLLLNVFEDDKKIENSLYSIDLCFKDESNIILYDDLSRISAVALYEIIDEENNSQDIFDIALDVDSDYINYMTYPSKVIKDTLKGKYLYLGILAIRRDLKGKGLSKTLLNMLKERARENNIDDIILWTDLHCDHTYYKHIGAIEVKKFNSPYYMGNKDHEFNTIIYKIKVD